jgi:uncharacterized damage-inducible protein DinB
MSELRKVVAEGLANEYREIQKAVHKWVDPLSTEQIWTNPFAFGNTIGHLLLHLTGNLSHYVGAEIARTGYVRNRPLEFTDDTRRSKDDVLRAFDQAVAMVLETIGAQSEEDWCTPYTAAGHDAADRFSIVMHCATHLNHHLGQIIVVARQLGASSATPKGHV